MDKAKLFWSDGSQAVRLPQAFRLDADEVAISRQGHTPVIEPIAGGWAWRDALPAEVDEDVVRAPEEKVPQQHRPDLHLFP